MLKIFDTFFALNSSLSRRVKFLIADCEISSPLNYNNLSAIRWIRLSRMGRKASFRFRFNYIICCVSRNDSITTGKI